MDAGDDLDSLLQKSPTDPPAFDANTDNLPEESEAGFVPAPNPFLGGRWLERGSGFVYMFKPNGTLSVEHHCGLDFDDQFSYLIWDNKMLTYGSEMGSDELFAYTLSPLNDETVYAMISGSLLVFEYDGEDDSPPTPDVLDNDLLGEWTAADGSVWSFTDQGFLSVSPADAPAAEYSYLIRRDRLVTLAHADSTVTEYRISGSGAARTLVGTAAGGGTVILEK
jgi:hypothetical protein